MVAISDTFSLIVIEGLNLHVVDSFYFVMQY